MAVARNDLGRDRLGREAKLLGDMRFDRRVDVGEGADGTRNCAGRNVVARRDQPRPAAIEFGISLSELEPEGRRLGVDAVASADGRRELMFECAAFQDREQFVEVGDQKLGGLFQLNRKRRVEYVGAGHALVEVARLGAHLAARPGEESDHVMLGDRFDCVDRGDVDLAKHVGIVSGADPSRVLQRDHPDVAHRLGRENLNREPDPIAVFGRPDGRHFGA